MFADLVDRHDPRVSQLRDTAGLAQEPIPILVRRQAAGSGDLDRHDAVKLRVVRLVDGAEGPDPDGLDQLEPAQPAMVPGRSPGRCRLPLQPESRAAGGADDGRGGQADQLDGVAAVGTEDVNVQAVQQVTPLFGAQSFALNSFGIGSGDRPELSHAIEAGGSSC